MIIFVAISFRYTVSQHQLMDSVNMVVLELKLGPIPKFLIRFEIQIP